MAYTVQQIINIAKVSQFLAANEIQKKGVFGGGIDLNLPRKLYMIRKNVDWLNTLDSSDDSLVGTANYLLALCGRFGLMAASIISDGGSGTVVTPGTVQIIRSPIRIDSGDFVDATNWEGQNDDGQTILSQYTLQVYGDSILQRFLTEGTEWVRTPDGVEIIMPGFDATTNDYVLYIFISP